jgi:beta-glucosidase
MKRPVPVILAIVGLAFSALAQRETNDAVNLDALLRSMSLAEKIGQMVQVDVALFTIPNSSPIQLDTNKLREAIATYKVGSILNTGVGHVMSLDEWHYVIRTIQDMALAESPHKIPVIYGIDSTHGASYMLGSTLFPQNLALAATRNPDLVRECAHISAMETRAAGIRWTFAPVLDVGRQPLRTMRQCAWFGFWWMIFSRKPSIPTHYFG